MKRHTVLVSMISIFLSVNLFAQKEEKIDLKRSYLEECAKKEPDVSVIKKILTEKPSLLNKKNKGEETCLRMATENASVELFDLLIEKEGIDIESADFAKGYTPLAIAVALNKNPREEKSPLQTMAKKLIEKGADINACTDERADSVLMLAVYRANVEIVKILTGKKELKIDQRNESEKTALQMARALLKDAEAKKLEAEANKADEAELNRLTMLIDDYKDIITIVGDRKTGDASFLERVNGLEGLEIFLGLFIASGN